ncbi:hypothetical protein PPL_05454 [Heterostelium album PN500]|uniref:Cytochrome b5 heme-binding domain-containing protein n=1 Tax=Heterostelium pallidum (strain ATCC 26659 / Pp 5 / PN500) TaxID=670386 RepID=D3BA79_HETP5|nr:hypothetical protein PPL_05454 [Heterostelium album PN500]EFA81466.1 hypothetical protein PPL_05454 [Heterostelium album PN500]|eukprot:XP_020433584.1 hypothetical protein PPL_05454 [Heterostelium album PN500]
MSSTSTTSTGGGGGDCCGVGSGSGGGGKQRQQQQPKKQQQQQQQEKKPQSKGNKSEVSKYKFTTPKVVDMPVDAKYVDTHVHVDQIMMRMNMTLDQFPMFAAANFPPQFERLVQVCCDPVSLEYTDMLISFDQIFAAYGVHPHNASEYNDDIEAKLIQRMASPKVVAWGECGLDYFYNKSARPAQLSAFTRQLQAAVKCNKPVVVHSREAEEDTLRLLKENLPKDWKIHIHCFTSNIEFALALLEHFPNLYIGFTGCITFNNSESIRDSVSVVPIDRILLETDGPYMTPMPFRGQIANSGHIPQIANVIAGIKELSLEEVLTQCHYKMLDVPEEVIWGLLVCVIIYLIKTIWFPPAPPPVVRRAKPVYEKRDYTLEELKQFVGVDETNAVFVAIKGKIYDVSMKRSVYGPGGSYELFAGHDATTCLAKSSFDKVNLNKMDTSSLNQDEMDSLNHWVSFFDERYEVVGNVKPEQTKQD